MFSEILSLWAVWKTVLLEKQIHITASLIMLQMEAPFRVIFYLVEGLRVAVPSKKALCFQWPKKKTLNPKRKPTTKKMSIFTYHHRFPHGSRSTKGGSPAVKSSLGMDQLPFLSPTGLMGLLWTKELLKDISTDLKSQLPCWHICCLGIFGLFFPFPENLSILKALAKG